MRRWFSLALALAMCFTMVMGEAAFAFAEDEAVLEMVETEVPQDGDAELTDTEPEEDAQPEPGDGDDASNEEITDDTSESVDTDADQQPAEAPEEVDETGDTEDFELWYARTNASLTLEMDDAVGRTVPAGCVLLVVGEAGEGLLRVMCENLSGAVDASALERLTDDEGIPAEAVPLEAKGIKLRVTAPQAQIEAVAGADALLRTQTRQLGSVALQLDKGEINADAARALCALAATEARETAGALAAIPGAGETALCAGLMERLTELAQMQDTVAESALADAESQLRFDMGL